MIIDKLVEMGKLVPVIKIDDVNNALPLAQALIDGGIPCAEITYRTACAGEAIRLIKDTLKDKILVGAGTISSVAQAKDAIANGADFLVSPGFNNLVVKYCIENNITIIPGVSTCSEIENALNYGLYHLKFFPAEACGGVKFLRAISAPYPKVKFMPTGGLNSDNYLEYKALNNVFACGASFMATDNMINAKQFDLIAEKCRLIN